MKHLKGISRFLLCGALALSMVTPGLFVFAEGETGEMAHDPSRNVQTQGVGNPFQYGERNTPANASTEEIRAINHKMTVQEVKYSLYKEIDEHWDLLSVRLGQPEREKVYALFVGLATRESTLGGNGDGSDLETAYLDGFGVNSAHAYGPMQTAVTAFADCNPLFMKEDDVPEMFQYSFTPSNFYDCIISNHMGIRKVLHFVHFCLAEDGQSGYQVVRSSLKGFNTGWATYVPNDNGAYINYADEIIALGRWYYEEGHLYDNVFTWTNDTRVSPYRDVSNVWDFWGDGQPSLAEIADVPDTKGDVNLDAKLTVADAVLLGRWIVQDAELDTTQAANGDMDDNKLLNACDVTLLKKKLLTLQNNSPEVVEPNA